MRQKRILMLGGNAFQQSAILRAKELGYYVITADYCPDNPGHKYADEYYNVSTLNREKILGLACQLKIDGILSYASDVNAPTAAYVAETLGLPTNPLASIETLVQKHLFRRFMQEHGFPMPQGAVFSARDKALQYARGSRLPLMVKPVDSSGSKGVVKVMSIDQFEAAFDIAISYSISKTVIVEQFIERKGVQIDGDGFIQDGKIAFMGVMDQHQHHALNPYAPIGLSTPSVLDVGIQEKAQSIVQRIFDALNMRFGAFNLEYIVGNDGEVYILEIGPRNGGNYIADTQLYAQGVDMIKASICACVGDSYGDALVPKWHKCASSYVVHSEQDGVFDHIDIATNCGMKIVKQVLRVSSGDRVRRFCNGGDALGAMVIAFDDIDAMVREMDTNIWNDVKVVLRSCPK